MQAKIIIIYDSPIKNCEKLWLKEEMEKKGHIVAAIGSLWRISNIEQRGTSGKLAARVLTFWQAVKGLIRSGKHDVVICWSQWSGLFFNILPGSKKRYIISYNWLTPVPNEKTRFLYSKALQNKNLRAVINYPKTKKDILYAYQVKDCNNIVYIPDVFNNKEYFCQPEYTTKNRYCFSGGRANRDWNLMLNLARICPDIDFCLVVPRSDWGKGIILPENVTLYFDLKPEQYYKLLNDAYMAVYPLKEDRVSGLINIIKSIQKGKIVMTTNISFTEIYFPEECRSCLLPFNDIDAWKEEVSRVWNYNSKEYQCKVIKMQKYIKDTFTPRHAADKLDEIIKGF